jgi:hypothetical protein
MPADSVTSLLTAPTTVLGTGLNLGGAYLQSQAVMEANQANIDMQYDFAQNNMLWMADQAEQLGIHPLAALGYSGPSPSMPIQPNTAIGTALQDIGGQITNASIQSANQVVNDPHIDFIENQMTEWAYVKMQAEKRNFGNLFHIRHQNNPEYPGYGKTVLVPDPELQLEGIAPFHMLTIGNPAVMGKMLDAHMTSIPEKVFDLTSDATKNVLEKSLTAAREMGIRVEKLNESGKRALSIFMNDMARKFKSLTGRRDRRLYEDSKPKQPELVK